MIQGGESLEPHRINTIDNLFIKGWFIDPIVCNNIIEYFESAPDNIKYFGTTGSSDSSGQYVEKLDKSKKDSLDAAFYATDTNPIFVKYLDELKNVIELYKKIFYYCDNTTSPWYISERINIQKYLPNQGFHIFHHEKSNIETCKRHLVFMTYLNDVTDDGETEWYYQKLKIKPEKGLTVIWPTDWTHTHRGITSKTQTKYIVTGWYSKY